ncbi:FAD-binding domain-containing protein [Gymnopus androsaceus JB14]|uniref:FAD-binding domain-containing protein n=1 Tax=Gymnopus androsaceus JB14 TaxID=1447944 RepID=A0A6A4HT54_9AGAR|nr:FAD-binding domain-containing protein [Gymnopus androsaceus JB14]
MTPTTNLFVSLFSLSLLQVIQTLQSTTPTTLDWTALNKTLGGRLYTARPFASPCFPDFDGLSVPRIEANCEVIEDNYFNATFRSTQFGSFMTTQWESCMSTDSQCTLDSSDPSDFLAWTDLPCDQGSVAPYYIDVQNYTDVQIALNFSSNTGVPLSIKNSGHDYFGRSSMVGSLALWVMILRHINVYSQLSFNASFVPDGGSESYPAMTIGAGVPWADAYAFADSNNVTIVGGYAETVGASGGWVMGGGHSVLSPVLGLGIDRVLEFKLVTPDGEYRTANAYTNPDLFWALRGGGGGTFGVVLESTSVVEPGAMTLQVASLSFDPTSETGIQFIQLLTENSLQWAQQGWGGHFTINGLILVNPLLTLEEAQSSMQNATEFIQSQNGTVTIETLPSWYEFYVKYVISYQSTVGLEATLASRLIPSSLFETEDGRNTFVQAIADMPAAAQDILTITAVAPFLFNATANSTSATPAWRDSVWHVSFLFYREFLSLRKTKSLLSRPQIIIPKPLISIAPDSGAYMNEANVYEPNYEQAFWGENYPQLLAIKEKYDPSGLLGCWRCVGWTGVNDTRSQCYLPLN